MGGGGKKERIGKDPLASVSPLGIICHAYLGDALFAFGISPTMDGDMHRTANISLLLVYFASRDLQRPQGKLRGSGPLKLSAWSS